MEMGFAEIRAKKGLMFGNGNDMENAVNWIMEHQEDADIDEPVPEGNTAAAAAMDVDGGAGAGAGAGSGKLACVGRSGVSSLLLVVVSLASRCTWSVCGDRSVCVGSGYAVKRNMCTYPTIESRRGNKFARSRRPCRSRDARTPHVLTRLSLPCTGAVAVLRACWFVVYTCCFLQGPPRRAWGNRLSRTLRRQSCTPTR